MAITVGTISTHTSGSGSTATWSHSNDGDYLVVAVASHITDAAGNPTGVTYNAVSMTKIAERAYSSSNGVTLWGLVAPAAGANNVVVSWGSGTANPRSAGALSFSGVDASTPVGTPTDGGSAGSSAPSIAVASASGELVVDAVCIWQDSATATTGTVGADQTERVQVGYTVARKLLVSTEAGATTTTMSWSLDNSCRTRHAGIALKPAAATGGGRLVGGGLVNGAASRRLLAG